MVAWGAVVGERDADGCGMLAQVSRTARAGLRARSVGKAGCPVRLTGQLMVAIHGPRGNSPVRRQFPLAKNHEN